MDCVRQLIAEKKKVSPQTIKSLFLGEENGDYSLCKLITYHNTSMKEILAPGTLKNYFTTERYLKLFLEKKHKTKDFPLSELNYQFITKFEVFLRRTTTLDEKNPLTNNGIMKHIERFRKMVAMAAKMEWIVRDPFTQYTLRSLKVDKDFLSDTELKEVEEKEFPVVKLNLAKDLFIFSCYSGLSYIDLDMLEPREIVIGLDGEEWIHTTRAKTNTVVMVPLLPKANNYLKNIQMICG